MKKYLFLFICIAALLSACKKEKRFDEYIASVSVSPTENALRFDVNIEKKAECSPVVQVRKKGTEQWQAMPGTVALLLYPETEYEVRVKAGDLYGGEQTFITGAIPEEVPTYELTVNNGGPETGYVMQWKESARGYMTICDPWGKVVWYDSFEGGVRCADYNSRTGLICALTGTKQIPGMLTPRPGTNITVLNLEGKRHASFDMTADKTENPHHELKWADDSHMILVNHTNRTIDLSSVGADAESLVWGDDIDVIDMEGNIIWKWDVLDYLDVAKESDHLPMEKLFDIVHMNSASVDSEGNYYASLLWIKEIWKIDGKTGEVLYRLGPHGDITVEGGLTVGGYHSIVVLEPDVFLVNNNSETMTDPTYGILYEVNAKSKTAKCAVKVPLSSEYTSTTGGYFQILPDNNTVMFDSTQGKCCAFTDMDGNVLRVFKRKDTSYRAFFFEKMF